MNFSRRPTWQYGRWCKQTSKGSQQKVESIDERSARICVNSVSIKETASLLSISDWIESFKRKIYFSVTFVIKQCKRFFWNMYRGMHKQYENKDFCLRPNRSKACHQCHEWLTEMYFASSDVFERSLHIKL